LVGVRAGQREAGEAGVRELGAVDLTESVRTLGGLAGEDLGLAEAGEGVAVEGLAATLRALRVVGGIAPEDRHIEALLLELRDKGGRLGAGARVVDQCGIERT